MTILDYYIEIFPKLIPGIQKTLLMTLIAIFFGFILGIALALTRVYGKKALSTISTTYIEIIRGTPLLVQLFIIYYSIPAIGYNPTPMNAALIGLSLNSAAYQAEYIRGSIQSIGSGQMIAARTMGMSKIKSIRHVILPQSLRMTIPAWSNELIYLLKYTSITYIITVRELFAEGRFIFVENFRVIETLTLIAGIYLFFTFIFTDIIDRIEKKVRIPGIGAVESEREA